MKKIIVFGNSSSGKSTLAKRLTNKHSLAHLDLDTLAWQQTPEPERRCLTDSHKEILIFIRANTEWVIEGCYSDLLQLVLLEANEIIYMNLSTEDCIANAKRRPWEPHKYESKRAQDANLGMLIDWISQYDKRTDACSKHAHDMLYRGYGGKKTMITNVED